MISCPGYAPSLLGFPKPTVHRILSTLEQAGWVDRMDRDGVYRLGIRVKSRVGSLVQ